MPERDQELKRIILAHLIEFESSIERLKKQTLNEIVSYSEEYVVDLYKPVFFGIDDCIETVTQFHPDKASDQLFFCMRSLNAINVQLDYIAVANSTVSNIPQKVVSSVSSKLNLILSSLKAQLQRIQGLIGQLLSKYLNLKEWSVKGSLSTPTLANLFGLTASAELELTFEP